MRTTNRVLPKEVTALIHHVELNRAGWWDKTLNRLILAAVWLSNGNASEADINRSLRDDWGLNVGMDKLKSSLKSLLSGNSLIELLDGRYRIPDNVKDQFEKEISTSEKTEAEAREYFFTLLKAECSDLDAPDVWDVFENSFLNPMVRNSGARIFRLVAGDSERLNDSYFDQFLKKFQTDQQRALKSVINRFIDPKREATRSYIIRLLHAHFCVEASGISEETLKNITKGHIRFRIFVDTNFLFSLLELHDNPSNASAIELKEILSTISGNLKIDLYVTPKTITEAKKALVAAKMQVLGIPNTQNFSNAALHVGVSGLAARFFSDKSNRHNDMSANEWFDFYLDNFLEIVKNAGIRLFNEKLDEYATRQDVIDDIQDTMNYEERRLPQSRRKSYEKAAHDIILWHLVRDKRSAYVESLLDARDWILTIDFRFINFDKYKLNSSESNVPLCLSPTSLIQLLQFWIPRTQKFEEAVLGSLKLPFLFREFDADAERLSLTIMKELGRFEDRENFPQETLVKVIMNEGLRTRINSGVPDENAEELIRDELMREMILQTQQNKKTTEDLKYVLEDKEVDIVRLQNEGEEKDKEIDKLQKKVDEEQQRHEDKAIEMKQTVEVLRTSLERLSNQISLFKYLGFLTIISVTSFVIPWKSQIPFIEALNRPSSIGIKFALGFTIFIGLHRLLEFRENQIGQLSLFKKIRSFRKWLWAIVGAVAISVVANLISDWI